MQYILTGIFYWSFQVQKQVHPSLTIKEDAVSYIETFVIQMFSVLCAGQPHTVIDVEDRVQKKVPHPIDQWAISDAQMAIDKTRNKKTSHLVLPVDKIHQALVKVGIRLIVNLHYEM